MDDPKEDCEDTAGVDVNASPWITGSGRTNMSGGVKSQQRLKCAEAWGRCELRVDFPVVEKA